MEEFVFAIEFIVIVCTLLGIVFYFIYLKDMINEINEKCDKLLKKRRKKFYEK